MKTILVLFLTMSLWAMGAWANVDEEEFSGPASDVGNENSVPSEAQMGEPTFVGFGCPAGSTDAVLSTDKKTISILFDEFGLLAAEDDPERRLHTSCEVILPFRVPAGMSVSVVRLDYRGYNYIAEESASITYTASYFLTGLKKNGKITHLARRKKKLVGPLDDEFYLSSRIKNKQEWSRCGEDFDFHILNEINIDRKKTGSEVEALIDSIDGTATSGVKYHLNWKRCDGKPGNGKGKRLTLASPA